MSAIILWIMGFIWLIVVPAIIVVEDRGASRVWSFVVWGVITAAALTGYAMWTFVRAGGV